MGGNGSLVREYYDTEWGMPVRDEHGMFERIALEGFQSGLSWATVLRKRDALRRAFFRFDPDSVAAMTNGDIERLLGDPSIIRHRGKIEATIVNAQLVIDMRSSGGIVDFVWSFLPDCTPEPVDVSDIPTQSKGSSGARPANR